MNTRTLELLRNRGLSDEEIEDMRYQDKMDDMDDIPEDEGYPEDD
jgi:hypothetical protein